jgi:integrase
LRTESIRLKNLDFSDNCLKYRWNGRFLMLPLVTPYFLEFLSKRVILVTRATKVTSCNPKAQTMRQKISKSAVDALRVGQFIADSNPVGFTARRLKSGTVTYGYRYRDRKTGGRQRWIGLGIHGELTPEQARKKALRVAAEIRDGGTPTSAAETATKRRQSFGYSVDQLLDDFLARYARPNLRGAAEIERVFKVDVRPRLGSKLARDLKRLDIVELLDAIEDRGSPVQADRTLAHLRKALNWYASRNDQFNSPIVKGMARTKPTERARKRTLDDQEIRDLYAALDALHGTTAVPKCFAVFTRFLLLSAQRLRMVSNMRWEEIDGHDWIVPEHRHKGKGKGAFVLPLTDELLALIGPKQKAGFVFTSDGGKTSFKGFSKAKTALDAKLAGIRKAAGRKPMQPWVYHDLRRSSRSLMSRAQVPSDHAERTLAHTIGGIRGVYDRFQYRDEKLAALEKLGALVERILHPDEAIIRFPKGRKKRQAESPGSVHSAGPG